MTETRSDPERERRPPEASLQAPTALAQAHPWLRPMWILVAVGSAAILLEALQKLDGPLSASLLAASSFLGAGLTVAGAALLAGGLLGFVFGIPRALQGHSEGSIQGVVYLPNTNLEQISDWLTKILVGIGLIQLKSLPEWFVRVNKYLAGAFLDGPRSESFVAALLVYWAAFGFLLGYLFTRVLLPGVLRRADAEALEKSVRRVAAEAEKSVRRVAAEATLEGLMHSSLYRDGGYAEALSAFEEHLGSAGEPTNARLWLYAACAWGQNYRELQSKGASPAELANARGQALEAVKKTLAIDPAQKSLLSLLLDGSTPGENDLAVFRNDEDFKKLLS